LQPGLPALKALQERVDGFGARLFARQARIVVENFRDLLNQRPIGFVYGLGVRLPNPKRGKLADAAHHRLVLVALLDFQF